MTYKALVDYFCDEKDLPVHVNQVLGWIRENTDHKNITLHGVDRDKKSFRGGFRRRAVNIGRPYSQDSDDIVIYTDVLYGSDLPDEWKRLVIVKEVIHVFDGPGVRVDSPEKLNKLIPDIIAKQLGTPVFEPALNDRLGAFRAMAVLLPPPLRDRMKEAVASDSRSISEVASFCQLPEAYVDLWVRHSEMIEPILFE